MRAIVCFVCAWLASCAPAAARAAEAFFPFAVYDKSELAPGSEQWRAHYRRLFAVLVDSRINTLLIMPYRDVQHTLEIMDQARAHQVRVIMSVGNPLNREWDFIGPSYPFYAAYKHPSVIAYKYGDEPDDAADVAVLRKAYAALRPHTRLPIVTAMVGEDMDFATPPLASQAWDTLRTQVRMARHYPIRRTYDLSDWYRDKMKLPLHQWAQHMEQSATTPWWYVAQTFGKGVEKSDGSYWRLPTGRELNAMTHVALANGARGIIGYALQDHEKFLGLVDRQMQPRIARDGSLPLSGLAEVGAIVQRHAGLLLNHRRGKFAVSIDNREIIAVPRVDPRSDTELVYLVNMNVDRRARASLQIGSGRNADAARNLFAGESGGSVPIAASNGFFPVDLQPGEAQLWQLMGR